jgi:uncharacterized protein (DUF2235 family)
MPEPGMRGKLLSAWSIVRGLAFGAGLTRNVIEAYTYLMNYWERGDRVFLFGFSRGAYTVRVLAGMLHAVGLLPRGSENMVPYAMRLFKAVRGLNSGAEGGKDTKYWKVCKDFRRTLSRPIVDGDDNRHFKTHFIGVWDTVSSVGWVWDPVHFQYTYRNPSVSVVRHAVSIDERRWFFRQNLMAKPRGWGGRPPPDQDLLQLWFPGVHCDVGGGYPCDSADASRIWRPALEWMVEEAEAKGLVIDPARRAEVLPAIATGATEPWADKQDE